MSPRCSVFPPSTTPLSSLHRHHDRARGYHRCLGCHMRGSPLWCVRRRRSPIEHSPLFTGINAVLVVLALTILIPRYRQGGSNRVILVANCILFVSCTAHFALEFDHFYRVLVRFPKPTVSLGIDLLCRRTSASTASQSRPMFVLLQTCSYPSRTLSAT